MKLSWETFQVYYSESVYLSEWLKGKVILDIGASSPDSNLDRKNVNPQSQSQSIIAIAVSDYALYNL